ncbi:MAG: 16S rRNA (cytosine(1402)-N(4))-methyltransferase RsmH [Muribaculaceae bacterium]|nr:16S rRNA (cytosine(1402)-N(4))-methyltransferase RsmH [Muribaculaceae bacterium]
MNQEVYHIPVLLRQSVSALVTTPDGTYVDATLGGGGHSRAILAVLGTAGRLYGIDRDSDAIANAPADARFTAIHGNFRYLTNFLRYYETEGRVDGILADLGVSSHHFDSAERGFSFRADAPLDMRMNRSGGITAAELLATADEGRLADIFRLYGELRCARGLAKAIMSRRQSDPVTTTGALVAVATPMLNPASLKKELAQVFQALRIEVNGEMEALEAFLRATAAALRPGGRLVVITYHSLEDRLVKNFMRTGRTDGKLETDIYGRADMPFKALGSKPTVPDAAEIEANPRARSAKLRVAERTTSPLT